MEQPLPITIRSFRSSDLPICAQLFRDGLIGGQIAENDTALDIDDIDNAHRLLRVLGKKSR